MMDILQLRLQRALRLPHQVEDGVCVRIRLPSSTTIERLFSPTAPTQV